MLPGILGDQYRADANQLVTAFLERPLELATAIQQAIPVQPKSQTRLLLESVQAMVLLEERTDGLESRATEIESRQEKLEQRLLDESMNASEEGEIYALGQRLGREIGYGKAWRLFNARFKLASYKRLQRRFVPDGKRFLEFQIAAYCGSLV